MRSIDYKDLEVFSVVAQEGSIRAAALQLNLSQPSVSRRMTRLEQCLGRELLDRSTRGAVLTPAGRLLLPYIDRGKCLMDEMFAALEMSSSAATLDVWTDATLAPFVMSFVCDALGDLPVDLSNRVASPEKVLLAVEHGPADVAFGPRAPCPEGVVSVPFFRDALSFVVHPEHPLAASADVRLEEVAKHEVAVADCGETAGRLREQLRSVGMPPDRLRSVAPASTATMLSYRCGHVGVATRSSFLTAIREGLLVDVTPPDIEPLDVEVHLTFRRSDADNEGVCTVREAVEEVWRQSASPLPEIDLRSVAPQRAEDLQWMWGHPGMNPYSRSDA